MPNGTPSSLTCPLPQDVDTEAEGFVLKANVHSAKVMDWDGIKTLVQRTDEHFPRLKHLWVDAGYRGEDKGKEWALRRRSAGVWIWWSVLPPRTEEGARGMGLKQWSHEGVVVDWKKIMPPEGFVMLPRRWVVECSFAWICHNRRMSKDYERRCASGEAFVYAVMSRLMLRRLAGA